MSAIAAVLAAQGHRVSGSDLKASSALVRVEAAGVQVVVGHRAENVGDVDAVAISTAVPENNPEVVAARSRGIPVLSRAEVLSMLTRLRRTVGVAGTHGKTTTASMLALILAEAGFRPSFVIGGEVNEVGGGAAWMPGAAEDLLVVEADESDGTFLDLDVHLAMVTNVELDHLEHWGGFEPLRDAFASFLSRAAGPRVVCADDPVCAELGRAADALTYGTSPSAEFVITEVDPGRAGIGFTVVRNGDALARVSLPAAGLHNARNACGALVGALALGATAESAVRALSRFAGVARRFQFRGEAHGITVIDDYAHLAGEVRAILAAARDGGWSRVVAVFQPHRYSRTASLWGSFADAFSDADVVVLTDVYGAGEAPRPGVTGKLLVNAVLDAHPAKRVAWMPTQRDALGFLLSELRPGDLCLTLGAGDLTALPDELLVGLGSRAGRGRAGPAGPAGSEPGP